MFVTTIFENKHEYKKNINGKKEKQLSWKIIEKYKKFKE